MRINVKLYSKLSTCGVYTLLLFFSKDTTLTVGKLGVQMFPKGYYCYTGSARGSGSTNLKHRIGRHLKKEKRMFWHIDYVLKNQNVSVEAVVAAETKKKLECNINSYLKNSRITKVLVMGFGSSDCRKNCGSHLLYFPEIKKIDCLVQGLVENLKLLKDVHSVVLIE